MRGKPRNRGPRPVLRCFSILSRRSSASRACGSRICSSSPRTAAAGIGRRLLTELAALARARGCGRFEWAVLDWNTPAIGFYEQMGATLLPDWRIARVTGDALARFGLDRRD